MHFKDSENLYKWSLMHIQINRINIYSPGPAVAVSGEIKLGIF